MKKIAELRILSPEDLDSELLSTRKELQALYSKLSSGGSISQPSKIRILRRQIARILTIQNEA